MFLRSGSARLTHHLILFYYQVMFADARIVAADNSVTWRRPASRLVQVVVKHLLLFNLRGDTKLDLLTSLILDFLVCIIRDVIC